MESLKDSPKKKRRIKINWGSSSSKKPSEKISNTLPDGNPQKAGDRQIGKNLPIRPIQKENDNIESDLILPDDLSLDIEPLTITPDMHAELSDLIPDDTPDASDKPATIQIQESEGFHINLPGLGTPREKKIVPVSRSDTDLKKALSHEIESTEKGVGKKIIATLSRQKPDDLIDYDLEKHGSLLDIAIDTTIYRVLEEYWIDPGRTRVFIAYNKNTGQNEYLLYEPALSEFEYELLERLYEDLRMVLILTDDELAIDRRRILYQKVFGLLHEYGIVIPQKSIFKLEYFLIRNYLGWGRIDPLIKDPNIEDISCDGDEIPLFLYHRSYLNIITNITFQSDALTNLAISLAQRSGKHVSIGNPLIDATLPEGSRLQLSFGKEVTSRGTSFTIRKFRESPFTPIDLINTQTFNPHMLVFFWIAIENNKSIIFIGGTASGKTTSLNAVSLFIPPVTKVISIEDTREVTLYHDNWIASVTREWVTEGSHSINMFALLKAALRQRPEYILVGEVRGEEAQTLFQAMNTGHTTFSTMHAGSVDGAIHRLENQPLNVPRTMLQALNIISIQAQVYRGKERVRRCQEIVEIAGIDPATGNIMVNTVYEYDPITDVFNYTGRSQVLGSIASERGWSQEQLTEEFNQRLSVLNAMNTQNIHDYISVAKIFHAFYIRRDYVLERLNDLTEITK